GWCLDFGYWEATMHHDVPAEKIRAVPRWRDSGVFTELERLVLEYAEAMTETPPSVTDELVARLGQQLSEAQLMFAVAYRMLGTVVDAEDAIQDAWLRWSAAPRHEVADSRAYLARVITNTSLNRLRSARARREAYVGPWLPDPLLTEASPDSSERAELTESVSLAMLVVLESLTPQERAVFVLREVFGFGYAEIGTALGRSDVSVRQLAHRAREHVQARRPRFEVDRGQQREVTERFLDAAVGG